MKPAQTYLHPLKGFSQTLKVNSEGPTLGVGVQRGDQVRGRLHRQLGRRQGAGHRVGGVPPVAGVRHEVQPRLRPPRQVLVRVAVALRRRVGPHAWRQRRRRRLRVLVMLVYVQIFAGGCNTGRF